jgi:hypothetical protein
MERKEIETTKEVLDQIKTLEKFLEHANGEGRNHWWKIVMPISKEYSIDDDGTRERLKKFVMQEIETLKKSINLED